jgi:hypothetical protein
MFIKRRHVPSRRSFLKTLGVGSALLPLLQYEEAFGACAAVPGPKRMFIMAWSLGMLGGGDTWATTGDNWVLPTQMASLAPYRQDLLLLDGLDYDFLKDMPGSGERTGFAAFPGMLTGAFYQVLSSATSSDLAGGISIDQYVGLRLQASGYPGLVSLNLAVQPHSGGLLSWRSPGQAVIPDQNPAHVYATLFGSAPSSPPPDKVLAMRKSVLDYVAGDLNRFVTKVGGTDDRARVAAHLQNIRDIEQALAQQMAQTLPSTTCTAPVPDPSVVATANVYFEKVAQIQVDLAVAALAADATRVVVLQLGDPLDLNVILTSLGYTAGGPNASDANTGDVNGIYHLAKTDGPDKVKVDTWFMNQVAYVLGSLKGVSDGAGTMLDNTAFVAMNSMRTGAGKETVGVPAIMAGSCGGYFKTGRSLSLTNTPNNGVLVALGNAMGIPTVTFGETRYGGELTVLKG